MHPRRSPAIHPRRSAAPGVIANLARPRSAKELPNHIAGNGIQCKCSPAWPIRTTQVDHAVVINNRRLQRPDGRLLKMLLPRHCASRLIERHHHIPGQCGIYFAAAHRHPAMQLRSRAGGVLPYRLARLSVHCKDVALRCFNIENPINRNRRSLLIEVL